MKDQSQVRLGRLQNQPLYCTNVTKCSAKSIVYNWTADFAIFQNIPDFVLIIRPFYFFIQILQIWYQNKPEMYLLLLMYFNLHYFGFWNTMAFTNGKELFLTSLVVFKYNKYLLSCLLAIKLDWLLRCLLYGAWGSKIDNLWVLISCSSEKLSYTPLTHTTKSHHKSSLVVVSSKISS